MTRQFKELDFIINKRGTIARIMELPMFDIYKVKLRKVNMCKGQMSFNINTPYTHQSITSIIALDKNWKLISTEKVLNILCESYNKK